MQQIVMPLAEEMHAATRGMRNTAAWHPDSRASLALAAAAMLLVMAGFVALFASQPKLKLSQVSESTPEQLILTEPVSAPPARHPRHREPVPVPITPLPQSAWPSLPSPIVTSRPFSAQDYLDERRQQGAAALRDKVTAGDLQRNLGKAIDRPALSDGQGYRTGDGQRMVRSGDNCAQVQTVQGSSSPTNRTDIAMPTGCPGDSHDAGQEIGKALAEWAGKVQQSQAVPPGG